MPQGTFKNWIKDYGFIVSDNKAENDIFVHIKAVQASGLDSLPAGARVSYETAPDPRNAARLRAVDIKLIAA